MCKASSMISGSQCDRVSASPRVVKCVPNAEIEIGSEVSRDFNIFQDQMRETKKGIGVGILRASVEHAMARQYRSMRSRSEYV